MDRDEQLIYEKLVKLGKASDSKLLSKFNEEIRKIKERQRAQKLGTNRTQYFR